MEREELPTGVVLTYRAIEERPLLFGMKPMQAGLAFAVTGMGAILVFYAVNMIAAVAFATVALVGSFFALRWLTAQSLYWFEHLFGHGFGNQRWESGE